MPPKMVKRGQPKGAEMRFETKFANMLLQVKERLDTNHCQVQDIENHCQIIERLISGTQFGLSPWCIHAPKGI